MMVECFIFHPFLWCLPSDLDVILSLDSYYSPLWTAKLHPNELVHCRCNVHFPCQIKVTVQKIVSHFMGYLYPFL